MAPAKNMESKMRFKIKNFAEACFFKFYPALFLFVLLLCTGFLFFNIKSNGEDGDFRVRLAIVKNMKAVHLRGKDITVREMMSFKKVDEGNEFRIEKRGNRIFINGRSMAPVRGLIFISRENIYFNSLSLSGRIEVIDEEKGLTVVNDVELENYLVGVVSSEMNPSWHMEALKAQAVTARTYAVRKIMNSRENLYDVEITVQDQVYAGHGTGTERPMEAVFSTRGEVLSYNGEPAEVYFHSTCGGKTASSLEVWGKFLPYLVSVKCDYDAESPSYFWKFFISPEELRKNISAWRFDPGKIKKVRILGRTSSGRIKKIEIAGEKRSFIFTGEEFRKILGYTNIKSTNFIVSFYPGKLEFSGSGAGHGVGMCQWGAKGMAEKGFSYREILEHYFPGTRIIDYSKWLKEK